MKFNLVTIFPEIFNSYLNEGVIKRAIDNKIIKTKIINLREFTKDKRRTIDDTIYGGGAGMLLQIEPIYKAIKKIKRDRDHKIFLLAAKGKTFNQQEAKNLSQLKEITLICGRYEGVDERLKHFIDGEISIGDYVLSGGEIGAMTILDACSRLLPGVLGNNSSLDSESHTQKGVLEYPQYTKPEVFVVKDKKYRVPKVLLSGNHAEIAKWRQKQQKIKK